MPMNLNNLLHINDAPYYTSPVNSIIIRLREMIFSKKISVLKGTSIYDDLVTVGLNTEIQDSAFLILSEPANSTLTEDELHEFFRNYQLRIEEAESQGIPIVHLVTNIKWFSLFEDILSRQCLHIFISKNDFYNANFTCTLDNIIVLEDFIMPSSLQYYR